MEYQPNFPRDLNTFKTLISERHFNSDKINDEVCAAIIEKINCGIYEFTEQEKELMKAISNIGDISGCDDDHRICENNKICQYSQV
jgi:hypothetical protein